MGPATNRVSVLHAGVRGVGSTLGHRSTGVSREWAGVRFPRPGWGARECLLFEAGAALSDFGQVAELL